MKNDSFPSQLRESGWRHELTEAEQAAWRDYLAAHPEARPDWEQELTLSRALAGLPEVPVASNFTARVLAAVEREESGRHGWRGLWRLPLPRLAFVTAVLVFVGLAAHHHEMSNRRAALARSVALVTSQPLPSAEALENFDAIRRMGEPQHADDELLALMQ